MFGHSHPGGHTVHVDEPPIEKLPAKHDTELLTSWSGQLDPAGQIVHLCDPALANVPEEERRKMNNLKGNGKTTFIVILLIAEVFLFIP